MSDHVQLQIAREELRNMEIERNALRIALREALIKLAAIEDALDEATGYSVPYRRSRFMPIDSAFTDAIRAALATEASDV